MSLLLTKNCHYAILVAIEDGQHFKEQLGNDIYIISRLDLELPSQVDDLIPPNTRLLTKATPFIERPEFRTTLVYYVSARFLSRLRKRQARVTLEAMSLNEDTTSEKIGIIELQMKDAKLVKMRNGKQNLAQIQQFVIDKGSWLSMNTRGKIKAGLFIVEMPNSNIQNKEMGTPLQMPIKTNFFHQSFSSQSGDLGLEICSDMSELFMNVSEKDDDTSDFLSHKDLEYEDDDDDDYDQVDDDDIQDYMEERRLDDDDDDNDDEDDDENRIINVGIGEDQYSFLFRILEAKHIQAITENYSNVECVFFRYLFLGQEYQCDAETLMDGWKAIEYHHSIHLQGELQDIKDWLSKEEVIRVRLLIKQSTKAEARMVGFADVYLKDRDLNVVQQSSVIYDFDKNWYINEHKQFAKLQLQIGLLNGWDEPDLLNQST